ncbi:PREDICTED: CBL-interacting serine/threonine-protein kinase 18-like [Camelina sativa]|uniref:non-specific serine/threonine protein kinase n=1 Tax=Camelina sativa TaxID=90675 RepID=A0ABM0WZ73_CAMSA|nr:PREDICTED: CBL-interacting serine/threonine-protein kinase 18-like [Camelina sativa]
MDQALPKPPPVVTTVVPDPPPPPPTQPYVLRYMADLLGRIGIKDTDKDGNVSPQSPRSPRSPRNNILMGKYELGKLLGHGSFAKVYLAQNIKSGDKVAIKVIDKEKIMKSGLVAHIKREISILRRVRHPYIVHLFEVMATKTKIYFVMEYVRGGELFNAVAKGRLPEETARRYFQQLVSSVSFCHGCGVYHRDLKPENLLLDDKGNLKVSDFGLSAVAEQLRQDGLCHTFCGTPAYIAPEVLTRKGYDAAKADVWSCGVILFVLMAGHVPFYDKNIMVMYKKIYKGEFRCPRWFSSDLVRLLTRLLDTNPDTRITIPEIMKNRWFKKGFKNVKFYIEDDKLCREDEDEEEEASSSGRSSTVSESDAEFVMKRMGVGSMPRPASLNAFDIISFSSGFDLSGLFEEEEGGEGTRFISGAPVSKIISKLEEIAKVVSFTVRKKEWSLRLEGCREGAKGPLTIGAEIFELTPSLVVVEVKKKGGDREEYEEFCNKELRPELEKLIHQEVVVDEALNLPSDIE